MEDLKKLRDEIDRIDEKIVGLFEERMKVSESVAAYKRGVGKAVQDKKREDEKIAKVTELATTEFNRQGIESLYRHIMSISRMLQYQRLATETTETFGFAPYIPDFSPATRVVYTGVPGAYAQQALEGYFGESVESFHVQTFGDAVEAVNSGEADYGVLPIENSSTGGVMDVYDLLEAYHNHIVGEYILKVEHALLALPGTKLEDIHTVYSHPQGLMQCGRFLDEHRDWHQVSLQNTAEAAKKVRDDKDPGQAAIASMQAAKNFGLEVLKPCLNDIDNNSTRFVIITHPRVFEQQADKISICFELPHTSGTLYNILAHFIFNGLNMSKIESRPIKGQKWQYRFFIDFTGNLQEQTVRNALHGIRSETEHFRILGNYTGVES
ncbi:MAG TPA: prephenate dehydratase [Candidatus Onthocola gallistercoris]|uniref:Bifunctional chorismate mutase/prephenate dehydratase n=1 Tax=Candidatus Onthocola gallistercoris TaxID=2840876 RepID=A0A9D1HHC4_9FIRM|nr:prephenate dehydratase [Candidatus Onthocola gallistercoris]